MNFLKKIIKKHFTNFAYFYSILKIKLLLVICVSILVGLLDSVGLTLFLPLLQLAEGSTSQIELGNLNFLIDFLTYFGITLTLNKVLLFLICIFLVKGFVVYQSNIYKIKAQQILTKKVRMDIVDRFPTYKYKQFVKTDIGKIQNIFIGEISRLHGTYSNYIAMIQGGILIIIYMLFSFMVDWQFAILVCAGGLLSNLIFRSINKATKRVSSEISKVNNKFANILYQYILNFKYLKATGKAVRFRDKIGQSIDNVQLENLKLGVLNSKVIAFREPILICIVVIVIFIQLNFFVSTISTILISLLFFYRALVSIVIVQTNYNNTIGNQGAIDNILSFKQELDTHKDIVGKKPFEGFYDSITLKEVCFRYDTTVILDKISLNIPKNSSVAFVGESGSGKTTLVNIIIRLLDVNEGIILIDGCPLTSYNTFTYQHHIGYISQEPTIFNDTIYNNVTFWAGRSPENMDRFKQAIAKASLSDFIANLEAKEDTLLGANGMNLSGGQRQRISIARELFKDVQILILDEATSALDSETEKEIQESIDELKGQVTILSIAHRLSTIKNADIICLLDKGKIEASGSFTALTQQSNRFRRMVQLQEI